MNDSNPSPDRTGNGAQDSVRRELKTWWLWLRIGAVVGAILLAPLGFLAFGAIGIAYGAGLGAAAGGLGALLAYLWLTTS